MKNKRGIKEGGKVIFIIANLVLSIIAFSVLFSEFNLVSAAGVLPMNTPSLGISPALDKILGGLGLTTGNPGVAVSPVGGLMTKSYAYELATEETAGAAVSGEALPIPGAPVLPVGGATSETGIINPNFLNLKAGIMTKAIGAAIFHSILVLGAVYMITSMFGASSKESLALSAAAASGWLAGELTYKILMAKYSSLFEGTAAWSPLSAGGAITMGVGLVVGLIVLELLYKTESKKIVKFECLSWEAPLGGKDCEKCNNDLYPCSEYRCKSLGQACQLLNAGTDKEKCAWINPKDVNAPIISLWKEPLTKDYKYTPDDAVNPPDRGFKIQTTSGACIKAFTPINFGIQTDEPAQCKVDYNRTIKFDEMNYYFGGSNLYDYNHTQTLSLPSPEHINAEVPEIQNDGNYNLYIRCRDANGNENNGLFVFNFCVEKGPDVTAPIIEATSIANDMPFQYGLNETALDVFINEPSDCKWSRVNMDYDNMENSFSCSQHVWEMNNQMLYKCSGKLTDLQDYADNIFYFKCKDQPWLGDSADRNTNTEGYKFTLKGTRPLTIARVRPNETITGYSTLAVVNLEVETDNGYNYGDSWCSYSTTGEEKDYIQMYETGTNKHKQRLDLSSGSYTYYFQCVDLGGNAVYSKTEFNVQIDNNPPQIARVYQDSGKLRLITNEKATCSYSTNSEKECSFRIEEATNMPYVNSTDHYADWLAGKTYYIKCKDSNERQPATGCSIIVRTES